MLQNLTGTHAIVILAVVVLLFGAARLPALAKSVGQSVKILKDETAEPATQNVPVAAGSAQAEAATSAAATAQPVPAGSNPGLSVLPQATNQ